MGSCIELSEIYNNPWAHCELRFDPAIADEIAKHWPIDGFSWLRHSDIMMTNGESLRRYQKLENAFPDIAKQLYSKETESLFKDKFSIEIELFPQILLVEDSPGYRIRTHTDCAGKVISSQIYLADDGIPVEQGVVLQNRDGSIKRQVPYSFNYGYAFKVTDHSWHRVNKCEHRRRSIQMIYYNIPNPKI